MATRRSFCLLCFTEVNWHFVHNQWRIWRVRWGAWITIVFKNVTCLSDVVYATGNRDAVDWFGLIHFTSVSARFRLYRRSVADSSTRRRERTQVHRAQSSLAVTHPSTIAPISGVSSVINIWMLLNCLWTLLSSVWSIWASWLSPSDLFLESYLSSYGTEASKSRGRNPWIYIAHCIYAVPTNCVSLHTARNIFIYLNSFILTYLLTVNGFW